ncbi:undecaprenyldiphospho-muramoylpentapeptide beta-N-acetylglucosaminyltransferase [Candidatus Aerophobetes bacterium]|nr:undecaprenyldiphospho-muramoylpentapeptide beta-N-acetylglucosaminyltransferase [Candidatus Aerophobetes bacterium]
MKILVVAGGTGGHLYPAKAIASYLKEQNLIKDILWVGGGKEIEREIIVPQYKFKRINIQYCPRTLSLKWIRFIQELIVSFFQSFLIITQFKPTIVLGMGSFHSYPLVITAAFKGIPTIIFEQNVRLSLTNRFLLWWASTIVISFSETQKFIPLKRRRKTLLIGNPVRKEIIEEEKGEALRKLKLSKEVFTLLFMGGSQGAHSLNLYGVEALKSLEKEEVPEKIQIIFLTGKKDYQWVRESLKSLKFQSIVFPYLERMEYAYAACDLVISRSGATTIAEITARGLPSILIPYPYATSSHQLENAKLLQREGASYLILEKDLSGRIIKETILKLLRDQDLLKKMAKKSKNLGKPEATREVAKLIFKLAKK